MLEKWNDTKEIKDQGGILGIVGGNKKEWYIKKGGEEYKDPI